MEEKKEGLQNIQFIMEHTLFSSGEYRVKYVTGRGDYYICLLPVDDPLVIKTHLSPAPKGKDIVALRKKIKLEGIHYHINNVKY